MRCSRSRPLFRRASALIPSGAPFGVAVSLRAVALGAVAALGATVALGVASPLSAQVELALRGGITLAGLAGDADLTGFDESRRGLVAGASLTLPVGQRFGIRIGGGFAQKGATGSAMLEEAGEAEATTELDYVEGSVLFEATISGDGPVSLHFLAGPTAGYQLECKIVATIRHITATSECDQRDQPDLATWDFGVAGGAGLEVGLFAGLRLGAEALYTLGLSRLTDDPGVLRNRALLLQAGLVVPLG